MPPDLYTTLHSGVLALPKARDEDDFEKFLKNLFAAFLQAVNEMSDANWVTSSLKSRRTALAKLCAGIRRAVGYQFTGFPERAFDSLSRTINDVLPWLNMLGTRSDVSTHLTHLYRLRTGDLAGYDRPKLFHVPFDLRHRVKSQRYSIPGLPSLYLGGSLWICWEELGRPSFDQLHAARFRAVPHSAVRVLDFGYRPGMIGHLAGVLDSWLEEDNDNSQFILAHASCWPLLAACSVKVKHPGEPFVPEYIIPQLVLQWIRKHNHFEGIRYFSTRPTGDLASTEPADFNVVSAASNYVFPAMKSQPKGHCPELARRFEISTPLAWQIGLTTDMNMAEPIPGSERWLWEATADLPVRYLKTHFWQMERKLNALKCASISS